MADGRAFPQAIDINTGEELDEQNLGAWGLHTNLQNYVASGLGVTADDSAAEIVVNAGTAKIAHAGRLLHYELDTQVTLSFATTTGTNYVYATIDLSSLEAIDVVVTDTQGAPSDPKLLIAEVDGTDGSVTARNPNPDGQFVDLSAETASVSEAPSGSDDVARKAETDALDNAISGKADDPHGNSAHSTNYAADNHDHSGDAISPDSVDANEVANQNYIEAQETASAGSTYTADLAAANYHKLTLTGDVAIDFTNVAQSEINSLVLHLVQDGTGSRTPSFTPTVKWRGGSAPSWSTGANEEDVVTLVHDQDAGQWLGFVAGLGMA